MKHLWYFLIGIILLAGILRFWQLGTLPPSLYWDEVSQGYNAYSILQTGRDEHQELLPIARFQAFGDYKAPVNIYLTVPAILIFGKTEFAVRFASAFFGTLTVLATFFLAREFFWQVKRRDLYGLIAALLLAISPWHIQLSRAAYEGNIATFFTVFGVFFFLYSLRKQAWFLIFSAISFILAFYSFNAHRVFIPLFLLALGIIYHKALLSYQKQVAMAAVVGFIMLVPYLQFFSTPESRLRYQEVNIFSDLKTVEKSNELTASDANTPIGRIIHNRRILFAQEYLRNYFDFFHPSYLFFSGDVNPRFSHRDNGQLFLWMLPLLITGFYALARHPTRSGLVIIVWFLLAPVAAATARETPHALRSETFIPTFELIAAAGFVYLLTVFRNKYTPLLLWVLGVVSFFSVVQFWHGYALHNPRTYSQDWQYGYKEAIAYTESVKHKFDRIYLTDAYGRPSIYAAWYGNVSPQEYWKQAVVIRDEQGFYNVESLGKYRFITTLPEKHEASEKILAVLSPEMVRGDAKVLHRVRFLSGKEAFVIVEL